MTYFHYARTLLLLLVLAMSGWTTLTTLQAQADKTRLEIQQQVIFKVLTEDDPPRSFKQDGKVTGHDADIVQELLHRLKRIEPIELLPWEKAYQMALQGPDVMLFSVAKTPEREKLFRWVGPIGRSKLQLFTLAGQTPENDISLLKKKSVVSVSGWYTVDVLKEKGFANVVTTETPEAAIKMVEDKKADLLALPELTAAGTLMREKKALDTLRKVVDLDSTALYVALSPDVPDEAIQKIQGTLDQMQKDGFMARNQEKWIKIIQSGKN